MRAVLFTTSAVYSGVLALLVVLGAKRHSVFDWPIRWTVFDWPIRWTVFDWPVRWTVFDWPTRWTFDDSVDLLF